MQYASELAVDPLTVHIYGFPPEQLAKKITTTAFNLYEDEGTGTGYLSGKSQTTRLQFEQTSTSVRLHIEVQSGDGKYRSLDSRAYQLQFHGIHRPLGTVLINNRAVRQAPVRTHFRPLPTWSAGQAGTDVCISIPRRKQRLVVEFATPAGLTAAQ